VINVHLNDYFRCLDQNSNITLDLPNMQEHSSVLESAFDTTGWRMLVDELLSDKLKGHEDRRLCTVCK
jgi:hypothetical protein